MNPHSERLLENQSHRLCEDTVTDRALELPATQSLYSKRILENLANRLLENTAFDRALELPAAIIPITPTLLFYGNPNLQYTQNELPYLRCNVCNRKSYQMEYQGVQCNAWNSAPGLYPLQYCPGVLVPSVLSILPQLDFQLVLAERASL